MEKIQINKETLRKIFDFSKAMIGKHHENFMGKNVKEGRTDRQKFENAIQGKISEEVVKRYIEKKYPEANIEQEIDYGVYDIGQWDDNDLVVNGKRLSIKASKKNSVALMVEASRFDNDGNYLYSNDENNPNKVDSYIFATVNIPGFISWNDLRGNFEEFLENHNINEIYGKVEGFISHNKFWKIKTLIPRGTAMTGRNLYQICVKNKNPKLFKDKNSKVPMLADNYAVHKKQLKAF